LLLKHGAVVDSREDDGWTPLMLAAQNGKLDAVKALVAAKSDVNAKAADGLPVLHMPVQNGHHDVVKFLLDHEADVSCVHKGVSFLQIAAIYGHLETVRNLLQGGANPDQPLDEGRTALFAAAQYNHVAIARLLIDSGADINRAVDNITPLLVAAFAGSADVLAVLIEKGAAVDPVTNDRVATPLGSACQAGKTECARLLLRAGGDPNALQGGNWTILHNMLQNVLPAVPEIVELLLDHGADVNSRIPSGATPLIIAAQEGDVGIIQTLLRRGAEVDAETEDGRTALFQAALNQHPDAVEVLCEAGGNVCHVLGTGKTILQTALMSSSPSYDLVHKLISRGVDVNASDSRERTPLALATAGEQYEIAELLLENGADPR